MSPLIDSYERTINEQNKTIEELVKEYKNSDNKIKSLVDENKDLRNELEVKYTNLLNNKNLSDNIG